MKRKSWTENRYIRYTALFLIAAAAMLACFAVTGRSLVYGVDGFRQHYPAAERIRSTVKALLSGEGFRMVDLSVGQGLDVISTFAYYGLFDPMNLPAALLGNTELAYAVSIFLWLYLAGLFFCVYLDEIGLRDDWAVPIAALMYALCGFQMRGVPEHPYFGDGAMYLALMLIAVERVFRARKWLMLTLISALMLIANYYFAYKTTVLTVLYILIRLAFRIKDVGVKRSAGDGFALLGAYLLGAALSAAILLPVGVGYLNNARISSGASAKTLYEPQYYANVAAFLCVPGFSCGHWNVEGYSPIVFFAAAALFMRGEDKLRKPLRAGLILTLAMLCVPLAGRIMNGMGYAVNRWCYGFGFALCAASAWALPKFLEQKTAKRLCTAGGIYAAALLAFAALCAGTMRERILIAVGAAAVAAFAVLIFFAPRMNPKTAKRAIALLAAVCVAGFAAINCPPLERDFCKAGVAAQIRDELPQIASTGRADTGSDDNHASMLGYRGTGFYWSVVPDWVSRYYRDLEAPGLTYAFRLNGLRGDTALNAVAAVDTVAAQGDGIVPDGFTADADGVYRSETALPLGYAFHDAVSESEYAAMDPAQKRLTLLNCAVLEEETSDTAKFESRRLEWSIADAQDAELTEDMLFFRRDGEVTLRFEEAPDAEIFLRLKAPRALHGGRDHYVALDVASAAGRNRADITNPNDDFAYDQSGVFISLGSGVTECTLSCAHYAEIGFEAIELYAIPLEEMRRAITARSEETLENIREENDRITGEIEMNAPGILQIAVPYSEGWTAKVDGEDAEIVRCGGMYMGVALDAGMHAIELNYCTPGLKTGAWISACAAALILLLRLTPKKKNG